MKTETLTISLPAELAEFARQDMSLGSYGNLNEYVRDLVRTRREQRIARDIQFLVGLSKDAPVEDPGEPFFKRVSALQKQGRTVRKRKK